MKVTDWKISDPFKVADSRIVQWCKTLKEEQRKVDLHGQRSVQQNDYGLLYYWQYNNGRMQEW